MVRLLAKTVRVFILLPVVVSDIDQLLKQFHYRLSISWNVPECTK